MLSQDFFIFTFFCDIGRICKLLTIFFNLVFLNFNLIEEFVRLSACSKIIVFKRNGRSYYYHHKRKIQIKSKNTCTDTYLKDSDRHNHCCNLPILKFLYSNLKVCVFYIHILNIANFCVW